MDLQVVVEGYSVVVLFSGGWMLFSMMNINININIINNSGSCRFKPLSLCTLLLAATLQEPPTTYLLADCTGYSAA